MVYDISDYQPYQDQGFNFGEFAESIGDTIQSGVQNLGNNLDANGIQALAIANLNKAQADAIKSNAENRRQITKSIFTILIVAIIAVTVVTIGSKFWGK